MLADQFTLMATDSMATRLILLESTNHAMSVGLKVKKKEGKPHYVAEFFDPNVTASHVRIASESLHTFEMLTLQDFIADKNYQDYYPESDGLSMMFVRPSSQEEPGMPGPAQGAVANRTLTSSIGDQEINATALWHMLRNGFAGDLRHLKGEIARRPENKRIWLLAAKDNCGMPGLYMALQEGHADTIRTFGKLLPLVSPEERSELLMASFQGVSGLAEALKMGKLEALEQYIEIVRNTAPALSAKECTALLTVIRRSHATRIKLLTSEMWINQSSYEALKKKHPDFYRRFKEMKNALKRKQLIPILHHKAP